MIFLSNNHSSVDDQTADVISYLSNGTAEQQRLMDEFISEFPDYNDLIWFMGHVLTDESCVEPDYMSWVREWLDNHTSVFWLNGEPVILEEGDEDPEGDI